MHGRRRAGLRPGIVSPNMIPGSRPPCRTCLARLPVFWNRWIAASSPGRWRRMVATAASAGASARIRGLKLHLLYDPNQPRPVWFAVSSAKVEDVVAARAVPLEAGATYVFDKGYTDYRWWSAIRAAGAFFLTRRKRNAHCREIRYQPAEGEDILADRRLKIGHRRPRGGAPPNPLWDVGLRELVVARSGRAPLYLLTNDLERPAAEIARLYKQRWEIELLFKWLKQNLKIRRFWGRS